MQQALTDLFVLKATSGIGAAAGQRLLAEVIEAIPRSALGEQGAIVAIDLDGVELATTSFFKSSVLPLFQSARLSTDPAAQIMADAFGLPALNVYPVIVNARPEVEELADEIFGRRGFPILSLSCDGEGNLAGGRMVGFLDDILVRTMRAWTRNERYTAANLQDKFPEQTITQTAWSNRLNDLWRVRLLRRVRQGKSWIYQPIADGVNYG
jgi:hypothetical protein